MYVKGPYKTSPNSKWLWLVLVVLIAVPLVFVLRQWPSKAVAENTEKPQKKPLPQHVIIVDPGHGGTDPGACRAGIMEKDINLAIARELADQMSGFEVRLTRNSDIDFTRHGVYSKVAERQDLSSRIKLAHRYKGEIFLSLHVNTGEGQDSGALVYYDPRKTGNALLARAVQAELNKIPGVKPKEPRKDSFYLFDNLSIPVVLIETGWLCNPQERVNLLDHHYQQQLAQAIQRGVQAYYRNNEEQKNERTTQVRFVSIPK